MKNIGGVFINISVIIPNYNRKNLLLRAINSALNQTFKPIEVIIIDDASNFDLKKYLFHHFNNENRIKIKVNDKNIGAAASRNIGVNISKGDYIAFLDSDDYWDPQKLEKQVEILKKNKNLELIYCDQWIVSNEIHSESGKKLINKELWKELILNNWTGPNTSTLLINKKLFEKLKGFDERLTSCQDHDLWMRLAKIEVKLDYVPDKLSYFTREANNRISLDYNKRIKGTLMFLKKWKIEIVNSYGISKFRDFKDNYIFKVTFPILKHAFKQKKYVLAIKILLKFLLFNYCFHRKVLNKAFSSLKQSNNFIN
ncbi:MAG: glycosyltransferase family 2 protein [bacterium]